MYRKESHISPSVEMWLAVGTTCLCAEPAPAVTPFASCHKFADKQNGGFVRSAEAGSEH
ncbi:MAG: hypothetical protein U0N91_11435 [Oscillospiraceae bacterium]|nr:hypothetical protein [Ruminococcus sp.]